MILKNSKTKFCTPEEAVKIIKSGDSIYVHANCSTPQLLIESLCKRCRELTDVKIIHLMSFLEAPYIKDDMQKHFKLISLFTGANVRKAIHEGKGDFIPVFISEIPYLIESKRLPVDVCMLTLSPPDEHGYCSLGVSNECSKTAAENSKIIIAQINKRMPRVLGDNFIHIDKIDFAVETDESVPEFVHKIASHEAESVYEQIGRHISDMIEDGSTLQLGIGILPDKVLKHLYNKRDLGIHSEMFSDGLIDLVE